MRYLVLTYALLAGLLALLPGDARAQNDCWLDSTSAIGILPTTPGGRENTYTCRWLTAASTWIEISRPERDAQVGNFTGEAEYFDRREAQWLEVPTHPRRLDSHIYIDGKVQLRGISPGVFAIDTLRPSGQRGTRAQQHRLYLEILPPPQITALVPPPVAYATGDAPLGVTLAACEGQALLQWNDPDDNTILYYEYEETRYSAAQVAQPATWVAIPSSGYYTTHFVRSVNGYVAYKIRAVWEGATGAATQATPTTAVTWNSNVEDADKTCTGELEIPDFSPLQTPTADDVTTYNFMRWLLARTPGGVLAAQIALFIICTLIVGLAAAKGGMQSPIREMLAITVGVIAGASPLAFGVGNIIITVLFGIVWLITMLGLAFFSRR